MGTKKWLSPHEVPELGKQASKYAAFLHYSCNLYVAFTYWKSTQLQIWRYVYILWSYIVLVGELVTYYASWPLLNEAKAIVSEHL